jgi:hypothetical protein
MAKATEPGDSTQPLSPSQILDVRQNPPPRRAGDKNDQSIAWKGTVVGADEFAPAKKKSRGNWVMVGAVTVALGGGIAYAVWPSDEAPKEAPKQEAAPVSPPAPPPKQDPKPEAPPPKHEPEPAAAPPAVPADAGVVPDDAAPAPTPAKKKPQVKKKKHK